MPDRGRLPRYGEDLAHYSLSGDFMVPEKFRRQLRQEAEHWWAEGLIDAALYEKLAERYQLNALEQEASNRFVAILTGLGAILLGLGAITFVAANWQEWPRSLKLVVLLGSLLAVNGVGFYLWRRPLSQKGYQRLGQGLLLLGALLLGANLALMSQMFHQSGSVYELYLVWSFGVLAMAYGLRLTSLGIVSLILLGIGYLIGWFEGLSGLPRSNLQGMIQHMPLLVSLGFIPLAYWCRSRVIFGLSAVWVATSLTFNLRPFRLWGAGNGWMVAIAFILPTALLWSYGDRLWQRPSNSNGSQHPTYGFTAIAQSLALICFSIVLYLLSFRWQWQSPPKDFFVPALGATLIDALILAVFAMIHWVRLLHPRSLRQVLTQSVNSVTMAIALLLLGGVLVVHIDQAPMPIVSIFLVNLLLFLLAIALIRDGLALGARRTFWGGMVLLVFAIITRVLEYDTGLLFKSMVISLCGVGILAAGVWFERAIRPSRTSSLPESNR